MHKLLIVAAVVGLAVASCPNSCSGHGRCGQYDKCTCFYRWTGADCSERLCKEGLAWSNGDQYNPHGWAECSNRGVCDRTAGECDCFSGYEGAACQRSACPNDCSGHGICSYAHEIDTMPASEWDYWKIQGCRCDGGFTGQDCSERLCPLGDDPLTIPTAYDGDKWTVTLTSSDVSGTYTESFFLEIVDLYGTTYRSRALHVSAAVDAASSPATDALALRFEYLLLDVPALQSVIYTNATFSGTNNNILTLEFGLNQPTRLGDVRVNTITCVDGCYPYVPAPSASFSGATQILTGDEADPLVETVECSNRGLCDNTVGQCNCFSGSYGLACQYQTILV